MEQVGPTTVVEIQDDDSASPGLQRGLQKPRKGVAVTCEGCGVGYTVARLRPERAKQRLCPVCRGTKGIQSFHVKFTTPDSDRAQRVRAQGLVNKRLKLGWFEKPKHCMRCGGVPNKMEGHHPDYSKPDQVLWLCHSCHNVAHTHPEDVAHIAPFVCRDYRVASPRIGGAA